MSWPRDRGCHLLWREGRAGGMKTRTLSCRESWLRGAQCSHRSSGEGGRGVGGGDRKDQSDGSEDGEGAWGQAGRAMGDSHWSLHRNQPTNSCTSAPPDPKTHPVCAEPGVKKDALAPGLEPSVEAGPPQGGRGSS